MPNRTFRPVFMLFLAPTNLCIVSFCNPCSRVLYTLVVNDPEKVAKLRQTVPEALIHEIDAKATKAE